MICEVLVTFSVIENGWGCFVFVLAIQFRYFLFSQHNTVRLIGGSQYHLSVNPSHVIRHFGVDAWELGASTLDSPTGDAEQGRLLVAARQRTATVTRASVYHGLFYVHLDLSKSFIKSTKEGIVSFQIPFLTKLR